MCPAEAHVNKKEDRNRMRAQLECQALARGVVSAWSIAVFPCCPRVSAKTHGVPGEGLEACRVHSVRGV